jgi:hypothetical protein
MTFYTFANATTSIPLSNLDANFATPITLGNTAVTINGTFSSIGNLTLNNVTIASGNSTLTKETVTTLTSLAATALTIQSAGTTAMTIDTSQNVGIGTSSPATILHVSTSASNFAKFNSSNALGGYLSLATSGTEIGYLGTAQSLISGSNTDTAIRANNSLLFATGGGYERMRIDSSGNVGIGTSSPGSFYGNPAVLVVAKNQNALTQLGISNSTSGASAINRFTMVGGTSNSYVNFDLADNNGSPYGILGFGSGVQYISYSLFSAGYQSWSTNNTERMRVDSSGNLLVGTTSAVTSPTGGSLQSINGSSSQIFVRCSGATAGKYYQLGVNSSNAFIIYNNASAGVYLTDGATSWTGSSDENLKNITGTIKNGLEKISFLRAAEFTWKNDDTNKPQVGLIAQDVQKVLPEVIDTNGDGHLGVRYAEVIPLLVAAIQELKAEIDTLKGA